MLQELFGILSKYDGFLADVESRRNLMRNDKNRLPASKAEQEGVFNNERQAILDRVPAELENAAAVYLKAFTKNAARPTPADFSQATYNATVALQQIQAYPAEEWPGLVKAAFTANDLSMRDELNRCIAPRIGGESSAIAQNLYRDILRETRTPAEKLLHEVQCEYSAFKSSAGSFISLLYSPECNGTSDWSAYQQAVQEQAQKLAENS